MKNYKYHELIDIVKEVFSDYRRDSAKIGNNIMQTIERFFYDYDCVIKEGACEAAIVCSTLSIELAEIQEKTISKRHYDKLIGVLQQYDITQITGSINEDELELLNKQVIKAIGVLKGMKVIS